MIHIIWILSVLYRISTYFLFKALFPLQHICYYFNKPTPYRWTLKLSIVYIFTIHMSVLRPINHDYSWLLFDYISYSTNNTGRRCIVIIYGYTGKCDALITILLIFCLSCRVPLYPNVFYYLHIYNTFVVLTTDKPRLFTVVVLFHRIFFQKVGQTLLLCHQISQR